MTGRIIASVVGSMALAACATTHLMPFGGYARPDQLTGEWIDVRHTSSADTSLWVLRADGYDGTAHILAKADGSGAVTLLRTEHRYAWWYFDGALSDSAHRAICFSKRPGRDGPTCMPFSLDTVDDGHGARRHLLVRGYRGEHTAADRELVERKP